MKPLIHLTIAVLLLLLGNCLSDAEELAASSDTKRTLTLAVSPVNGRTTEPLPGAHTYDDNEAVTVTATAPDAHRLNHWSNATWCALTVVPPDPSSFDQITLSLSGVWGDTGVPNGMSVNLIGNTIHIQAVRSYPPGTFFLQVMTPWTLEKEVGPLAPGTYSVAASLQNYYPPASVGNMQVKGQLDLLRITVVEKLPDGSTRPVSGFRLEIRGPESFRSQVDGSVFTATVPEGKYTIQVSVPGCESGFKDVVVRPGEETDVTFELTCFPTIVDVLKAYLCVERFRLALKGGGRDKLQIRGSLNVRRPEVSVFPDDELFDLENDELTIEVDEFQIIVAPGSLRESAPGSGRYLYKDKASGVKMKLNLYAGGSSSKGAFAIAVTSSLNGQIDASGPITVRLKNGGFDQSSIFETVQKGRNARFTLGKAGNLFGPGLCITRMSILGNQRLVDPLRESKFFISGALATGGDNALALPNDIYLQVTENGFGDVIRGDDLKEKKGRYTFKAKREGIRSLVIDAEKGAFRISGSGADVRNVGGNPVKIILGIGDVDERQTNVDMVKAGKRLVY